MVFENGNIDQPAKINDYTLENVTWITYLRSVFTYDTNDIDCSQDLWTKIGKATEVLVHGEYLEK